MQAKDHLSTRALENLSREVNWRDLRKTLSKPYDSVIRPDGRKHSHAPGVLEGLFLQQYVKVIGPWLDAFDVDKYFSQVVPLEALGSPLLRTSISAVAAKQLGNLHALDSIDIDAYQRRILAEYARLCPLDMLFQAARFYDKAIRHILHMLQSLTIGQLSGQKAQNL
uniref:Uncharacterized protein n=1 Tax=Bionectria ochroleuca TaxID=29856 RepID=A0A8H7K877_BIOOC